jgi:hypothetical protein
MPFVYNVGAVASGTGAVTPAIPTGTDINDICLLFVETENQAVPAVTGYAEVLNSPVSVTTGTVTRLTVRWHRATGPESGTVSVGDSGDHQVARIIGVRGCIISGDPWNVTASTTELVSDTSASCPTITTTVPNCLILAAVATGTDVASTAHITGWTNANLSNITERVDNWVTDGLGGGMGVASGEKTTAGSVGATTATLTTANFKALMHIALKEQVTPVDPAETWLFGQTLVRTG